MQFNLLNFMPRQRMLLLKLIMVLELKELLQVHLDFFNVIGKVIEAS